MLVYAADDEKLALEMLEEAIKEAIPDVELYCFNKSRELLEKMEKKAADIVFLDIEMPGLSGIELAKALQEIKKDVNIIFCTGYSEYLLDAMDMFASGYILKPVDSGQIEKQLKHLRYRINTAKPVYIKTFGNFSVTNNGSPVNFRYYKSKELLAYLVDREGALVSRKQIEAVINEEGSYSRSDQKKLSRWIKELEDDLKEAGIERILNHEKTGLSVNKEEFDCDLYEYLHKHKKSLYHGEYMEDYSWGENFKSMHD